MRPGSVRDSRSKLVRLALALSMFPGALPAAADGHAVGGGGTLAKAAGEVDLSALHLVLTPRLSSRSLALARIEMPWVVAAHELPPSSATSMPVVADVVPWLSDIVLPAVSTYQPAGLIKVAYGGMSGPVGAPEAGLHLVAPVSESPRFAADQVSGPTDAVSEIRQAPPLEMVVMAVATSASVDGDVPVAVVAGPPVAAPAVVLAVVAEIEASASDAGPSWTSRTADDVPVAQAVAPLTAALETASADANSPRTTQAPPQAEPPVSPITGEAAAALSAKEDPSAESEVSDSAAASSLFWAAVNLGSQKVSKLLGMQREAAPTAISERPAAQETTPAALPPLVVAQANTEISPAAVAPAVVSMQLAEVDASASRQVQMPPATANADIKLAALTPPPKETWRVPSGVSLKQMLMEWASRAGWIVGWDATVDYETVISNEFKGDFEDAITDLFNSFPGAIPLRAELRTGNVPPLLIVTQSRRPLQ